MNRIPKLKGKFSASSRKWLIRQRNDPYVKRAVEQGYRSRAAYELIEIDDKLHLIRGARKIIDIGAAPGGWSQVLAQRSDDTAKIAAIDILQFNPIGDKVKQFLGDFEDENIQREIADFFGSSVDLIVSDMAPATVGHRQSDHWRIMGLVENAYEFSRNNLRSGGAFVAKIFHGSDEKMFFDKLRKDFRTAKFFKPKSSRSESVEIYVIGIGYKGTAQKSDEISDTIMSEISDEMFD